MSGAHASAGLPVQAQAHEVPALKLLAGHLQDGPLWVGPQGERLPIPASVQGVLRQVVDLLAAGKAVQLLPSDRWLTTQEAADLLAVSRPFLTKLMESRKQDPDPERRLAFAYVGNRRRIRLDEFLRFKARWDQERLGAAHDLLDLSQELGLYA